MNVLQLVDEPWDSGLTQYALTLARGLQGRGHQVAVAAVPEGPAWRQVQQWEIPLIALRGWVDLPALRHWIRTRSVHVLNPHTGRTHSLAACAGRHQSVLIRTRADARPVRRWFGYRWLLGRTDRVIAAAEFIRQQYVEGLKESRVTTIYQGVDGAAFPVRPWPSDLDRLRVGLIARFDPIKGHRVALEAFQRVLQSIPQSRLVLAGPPAAVTLEGLERLVQGMGLGHAVEVLGYVRDVGPLMGTCQVGLIASAGSEAVSRVALEWMATGRALVATRVGCLPELVVDGETGYLVPVGDAQAMADRVARLLRNPTLTTRLGHAARHRVETHFSLGQFVTRTEEVYADALAHRAS